LKRKINDGRVTGALAINFEGKEELRQMLINKVPKYGNDVDSVDQIAREVLQMYCTEVKKYRNIRGWTVHAGCIFNFSSCCPWQWC
jgi:pyruvate-formate lyase